jgi:Tol biopolymer transport system component
MALTSGTKLGPYEIQSPLGAGGMGEVYRARDTRLDRTVAVKILPAHLSSSSEAKQRFEREARTISSLNHPHICHLYDVGSQDGTDYLVMEYLEGETLDRRLQKGALPLKQALEYGTQICEALEKAHRAGIVHRDLKPGNMVLTASGAKLLDFGLAKPAAVVLGTSAAGGAGPLTPSTPTMNLSVLSAPASSLTQQGTVVGTFQYMAPEALRGQEADARSDIFSLGCVLYEMVTGRRAFEGRSQLSVLTAIFEKDPEPLSSVQPTTPPALDYAVRTCLEKNPEDRFQTAHDVKLQLAWIAKTGSQAGAPAAGTSKRTTNVLLLLTAASLLAVAAVGLAWWRWPPPRQVMRSTLLPPEGTHFALLNRNGPPAISPDGRRIAFIASREGKTSLWVRSLDKLTATELAGTEGAFFPFWSPDARFIGFFSNGKVWRIEVNGGSPAPLCDAPNGRGASWGKGNLILFAPDTGTAPIMRISADGGTPVAVTAAQTTHADSDRWPFLLPDGKHLLYLHTPVGSSDDRNEIHFTSIDGSGNKILLKGRYTIAQYASGWLLTGRDGVLLAQKFDPSTGALSGSVVQIADKVLFDGLVGSSIFTVSPNGLLVYQEGTGSFGERFRWVDANGKQNTEISEASVYGASRLSPDGSKIAFPETGGSAADIWMVDLALGARTRISFGGKNTDTPTWSPDGRSLYFAYTSANTPFQIYERPADGSRPQRLLIPTQNDSYVADVSSDGQWLLYEEGFSGTPKYSQLKAFPLGEEKPFPVLDRVDSQSNARLLPGSNQWLAYQSSESGRSEVYLTRFPSPITKYQVSSSGGTQPVWSRDGKRLYYLDAGQRLTVVEVQADNNSVQFHVPRVLFQTGIRASIGTGGYDVTRDGRFLLVNSVLESPVPLTLVMNWDAELEK